MTIREDNSLLVADKLLRWRPNEDYGEILPKYLGNQRTFNPDHSKILKPGSSHELTRGSKVRGVTLFDFYVGIVVFFNFKISCPVNANMMIGTKRKGSITEDDTTLLLQRYSATTILALLQEISQYADSKIDWNTLVKRTNTGISSAREYKMLWRHLAYRDALIEKLENGAETTDDDSDLEFELEPSPSVSNEASMEGAAAVKVLMAYGLSNDSGPSNRSTAETPLSLNAHNSQAVPSENLQLVCYALGSEGKQPLPTRSSLEGFDGNGPTSSNYQVRRKRKLWTHEEDMELIAAVQKCGEGNWASILKGNFKHDRTASQLSQRWAIIRKRKSNLNSSSSGGQTATTLTEAQLAARQAVSYALNMPMMGSLSAIGPPNSSIPVTTSEALLQQDPSVAPVLRAPCHSKPRPGQKKPSSSAPVKCSIQEVAVAAGARIATPSTAASLFKAAQAKNIVHVQRAGTLPFGSRSANVHYIRAASGVVPTVPRAAGQSGPMRLASISKPNLPAPSTSSSRPTQQSCLNSKSTSVVVPSSSSGEVVKNSGKLDSSSEIPEGLIKEEASSPNLTLDRDLTTIAGENLTLAVDSTAVSNTDSSENANMIEELTDKPVTEVDKDHSMGEEATCGNQSMDEAVACSLTSEYENQTVDRKQTNLANHGACDDQLATRKAGVSNPPVDNEVDKNTTMVSEVKVEMELDLPNDELLGEPTSFVRDARTDRIM